MNSMNITQAQIQEYANYLKREERAKGTIEKYVRDVSRFAEWIGNRVITKEVVTEWKNYLLELKYCPSTVNSMLASLHGFFHFTGIEGCNVKFLRIQRKIFRSGDKELNKAEYQKLVNAALSKNNERLALLIETICATGIRVSEVQYITIEAVKSGRAEVILKGKVRTILIPGKLAKKLKYYAKKRKIKAGEIFLTKNGTGLSRKQIWAEMKSICKKAGVEESKVFPHNLRHLFARTFYKTSKDIVRLADVLGHSNIETTRIYLITTCTEYMRWLDGLKLVC